MLENALSLLHHELKHLKHEGVEGVYLSEGSWDWLREAAARHLGAPQKTTPTAPTEATAAPSTPRICLEEVLENSTKEGASTLKVHLPKAHAPEPTLPPPPTVTLPEGPKEAQWEYLKERVLTCPECNKHVKPGKQVVFGVGSLDADIFFCGEAPGAEEEIQGEPFVGPAGALLTKIIQAMGLTRERVYIGNIMNWRPEMPTAYGNRPPTLEEMHYCLPFLKAQVSIIKPKVIVALGATAVTGLLGPEPKRTISALRGHWHHFENTPLMVTYHPSYLLRNNTLKTKRMVWEDMLKVMEKIKLPISEKQQAFFL